MSVNSLYIYKKKSQFVCQNVTIVFSATLLKLFVFRKSIQMTRELLFTFSNVYIYCLFTYTNVNIFYIFVTTLNVPLYITFYKLHFIVPHVIYALLYIAYSLNI